MKHSVWMALVVFFVGASAHAGNVLKFLKGDVDIRHQTQLFAADVDSQVWIVQFQSVITKADQKALKAAGAKVYRYIPEDALVVKGSRAHIEKALGGRLQGFMPFRGDFKLSESLPNLSVFTTEQRAVLSVVIVHEDEVAGVLRSLQMLVPEARVLQRKGRFLDLAIGLSELPMLASLPGVEFVEPRAEIESFLMNFGETQGPGAQASGDYTDLTGYETGTKIMNFEAAWAAGFTGQGEIVGIADTGLDMGDVSRLSADFQNAVHSGYVFGVGAKTWEDPMGHGTHVAGSVAGRGTASGGRLHGGAFNAMLIPEGMWSPIIENLTVPPKLADLFSAAYKDGARLHTNSWGAAKAGAYDSMAVQADDYLWNNPEMLVLFAAGNSGADKDKNGVIDPGSMATPGTAKNVLTVGASENQLAVGGIQKQVKDLRNAADNWGAEPIWSSKLSDNASGIACFSSRGPTRDGRLKPEIVAPGTNILSNFSHVAGASPLWGAYNGDYAFSGGTSMATPLAAGAAAVAREMLSKKYQVARPSGALVKAVLMHTAFDLFPGQYGQGSSTQELARRPNNDEGYGRVDMAKLSSLGASTQFVDSAGVATGEQVEFNLNVKQGQSLLANLVYFDAPGTAMASRALVNNVDMVLIGVDGQELGSHDSVNNHEIIELSNLASGSYKLVVKGVNVPMGRAGKQPFALIYTLQ